MKFLIAHQSLLRLARIKHQIMELSDSADILEASTLTDAYNLAEHYEPACVVMSQELADAGEFELLASLFGIMNIACIVLTTDQSAPRNHPLSSDIRMVTDSALEEAVRRALKLAKTEDAKPQADSDTITDKVAYDENRMILLGASTGGIDALLTVSQHFGRDSPPVLVVQHTGGSFAKSLIRLLNGASPANVVAAVNGAPLEQGHVYLPPDDQAHLTLTAGRRREIVLQQEAPVSGHRPSIDALFTSAIPHAQKTSAALLTGMGKDGAAGLTKLRRAGAHTIGQDQRTSVVYGMPRVAMEMGGVGTQLPIQEIGPALLQSCIARQRA